VAYAERDFLYLDVCIFQLEMQKMSENAFVGGASPGRAEEVIKVSK